MNPNEISGKAMLVSLQITSWGNTRKDKRVTDETNQQHGASADAGRYSKHLLPPVELEAIGSFANAWRKWHRQQTLPWLDEGARILTTKNFIEFAAETKSKRYEFERLVSNFVSRYPQLVADAPSRLNGMFDPANYPDVSQIAGRFTATVNYAPVPLSQDFRVGLQSEQLDSLKADYEKNLSQAVEAAKRDVVERLAKPLAHMAELLRKKDIKGAAIRNELIGNLREAVVLIPQLRLDDDSAFDALLKQADKLADVDVDTLRLSEIARRDTAEEAERISKQLEGYFGN